MVTLTDYATNKLVLEVAVKYNDWEKKCFKVSKISSISSVTIQLGNCVKVGHPNRKH